MERKIENGMESGTACCRDLGLGSRWVDYETRMLFNRFRVQ